MLDLSLAILALLFIAPLIIVLAMMVKASDGGPAFFAHRRIGKDGRSFDCLKLRTMYPDAAERLQQILDGCPCARAEWAKDHKLKDDPRVTPLGRFLRRSSLDELPQLINIIAGDMSVVGPRPIVEAEVRRYGSHFHDYCKVRPGLTGLWQVSGRNDVDYRRRVAMDVLYCRRRSLALDVSIIVKTVPAILYSRGCY
jgi:lipopolysaccharide/colanic/teichoic acid biosynthesis glycosyltransferase